MSTDTKIDENVARRIGMLVRLTVTVLVVSAGTVIVLLAALGPATFGFLVWALVVAGAALLLLVSGTLTLWPEVVDELRYSPPDLLAIFGMWAVWVLGLLWCAAMAVLAVMAVLRLVPPTDTLGWLTCAAIPTAFLGGVFAYELITE